MAVPGVEVALVAPTLTVFPPSDAVLVFVAAHATNAPWLPTMNTTAAAIQILSGRDTRLS